MLRLRRLSPRVNALHPHAPGAVRRDPPAKIVRQRRVDPVAPLTQNPYLTAGRQRQDTVCIIRRRQPGFDVLSGHNRQVSPLAAGLERIKGKGRARKNNGRKNNQQAESQRAAAQKKKVRQAEKYTQNAMDAVMEYWVGVPVSM